MENKKIMVVFYRTELDEIMDASYSDKGIEVRSLIRKVWKEDGRELRMEV